MTPQRILGVDPGERHVGWCVLRNDGGGWFADEVREYTHRESMDAFAHLAVNDPVDHWVVEEFRLYPDRAGAQTGSTMPTCELIGVFKYLHRLQTDPTPLWLQPASIKIPTLAVMKRVGVPHLAVKKRVGGHAKDAETHAWHHVLRTLKQAPMPSAQLPY